MTIFPGKVPNPGNRKKLQITGNRNDYRDAGARGNHPKTGKVPAPAVEK